MSLPSNEAVQRLLQYLAAAKRKAGIPLVEVTTLKAECNLSDSEFSTLVQHFNNRAFRLVGSARLQVMDSVLQYESRLPRCTFADAHQFFGNVAAYGHRQRLFRMFAAAQAQPPPGIVLKAILEFGSKVEDGRLVEAVALPWFEIMEMIRRDPESIYGINPFTWEEIIAGAYTRAGFDEVILTPRSGDKGRDVIATKRGIGSVRFFDQVKAYRPGHLVTAEEVRAMVGTVTAAQNVSKGIITTTSDFAPRIKTDDFVRHMIPYRLELKGRQELLHWLDDLSSSADNSPTDPREA